MKGLKVYYRIMAGVTVFFMIWYPFLTYFHAEKPSGRELRYFAKKSKVLVDMFLYQKEKMLFIFAIFLLLAMVTGGMLFYVLKEEIPFRFCLQKKIFGAVSVYFLLNVFSVLLSSYKEYGVMGLHIDYEGLAAIFGYMVLFAAGYFLFQNEKNRVLLKAGIKILAFFIILGTALEMKYGPLFNIEWIQKLLTPDHYEHLLEHLYLDYHGSVSLTFANPGFFGGFCALLFPILLGMGIQEEKRGKRWINTGLAGGMFFCILMSGSSGALYAGLLAAFFQIFFRIKKENWKRRIGLAGEMVLLLFLFSAALQFLVLHGQNNIWKKTESSLVNTQYTRNESVFAVEKIQLQQGKLKVWGEEGNFTTEVLSEGSDLHLQDFMFTDDRGEQIETESGRLTGDFKKIKAEVMGQILSFDFGYQEPVEFYAESGKLYYIDFNGSLLQKIPQPVMRGLERFYPLFTGRGYIWISSIPVLMDTMLLGKGIGAFPFVYPQSEVAGMLNVHGSADYCIEQAHSWYLQTAVSSGILSLFCMLYVFFTAFKKGIKEKKPDVFFWGIMAYIITGLVNNSNVAAAPFFWLLLGCFLVPEKTDRI